MFLEFANKEFREFKLGGTKHFHFINDGKPFEVADIVGNELLSELASVDGEMVKVFKVSKKETTEVESEQSAEGSSETGEVSTKKKGVK